MSFSYLRDKGETARSSVAIMGRRDFRPHICYKLERLAVHLVVAGGLPLHSEGLGGKARRAHPKIVIQVLGTQCAPNFPFEAPTTTSGSRPC
jgi:hypothetical protein